MLHRMKGELTPSILNISTVTKTFTLIEHHFPILYPTLPRGIRRALLMYVPGVKVDDYITYRLL
jgi:hypothetical protein